MGSLQLAHHGGAHSAERALYRSESRLRGILETADTAFLSVDHEGLILDWNAKAEALFQWPREEAVGRPLIGTLCHAKLDLDDLSGRDPFELGLRRRDGHEFPAALTVSRLPAGDAHIFQIFVHDMASQREAEQGRRNAEEHLTHQALHDELTGLPNRALFLEHLDHALALARRNASTVAVLVFDVDNLGAVNDSLGHFAGDRLLLAIAGRLEEAFRASDTLSRVDADAVARMGGDEFAVICEHVAGPEAAIAAADRAAATLASPFQIAGEQVFITVSTGIALGTPEASGESLLRDAGTATREAKARGRNRHQMFEAAMHGRARHRLSGENELRSAIERRELRLHYQPIVSVADGGLVGVEALVRWQHPDRGLLAPAEFLPLAEQSGLIVPLGRWVFEEAFTQAVAWYEQGGTDLPLRISVNVSGHQLARPEIADEIVQLLEKCGMEPTRLALEITESVLMADLETPVDTLRRLHKIGVRILLDDFGTGYSSLTYLRRLPLDAVKLDRSFVSQLDKTTPDRQIVAAVIQLARALEMTAIAEGVETEEQLAGLRDLGCHFAQGYHFARPMPAGDLIPWLTKEEGKDV